MGYSLLSGTSLHCIWNQTTGSKSKESKIFLDFWDFFSLSESIFLGFFLFQKVSRKWRKDQIPLIRQGWGHRIVIIDMFVCVFSKCFCHCRCLFVGQVMSPHQFLIKSLKGHKSLRVFSGSVYQQCIGRVASGVSNIIDHTLTKRPIINRFLFFQLFSVKFFANTIETDNLENFLCTLYINRF